MTRRTVPTEDDALARARQVMGAAGAQSFDMDREYAALAAGYGKLLRKLHKTLVISDSYQGRLKELMKRLEDTTLKYRQLKDVALPLCMHCKKVRADNNYWQQLETYFGTHADVMFSHGICPDCIESSYKQLGVRLGRDLLPGRPQLGGKPAGREPREAVEDDLLIEMRALERQSAVDGNPLAPDLERLATRYAKLLRRFTKTMSISDGYQSQLMDLKARLEITARTDLLTGLANRWEIMARLEAEQSRAARHGTPFSLLICDIDHFKAINDTYGHNAGDRLLKAVADTLRRAVRNEDFCGRWGGEEFLVMLPETGLRQASQVAAKLLAAVRETRVGWEDASLSVTMSIGVGEFDPGMSIDHCLKQVDDALYSAKNSGRDRCLLAGQGG